jgi:hypothetical protein
MNEPIRVTYQGVVPSDALRQVVARQLQRLEPFRAAMEDGHLELQRWHHHHQQGTSYRVALEVDVPKRAIKLSREAAQESDPRALERLLQNAVDAAERALNVLQAEPLLGRHHLAATQAEEARRLHALHGRSPDDA